jgi:hypothetical protein
MNICTPFPLAFLSVRSDGLLTYRVATKSSRWQTGASRSSKSIESRQGPVLEIEYSLNSPGEELYAGHCQLYTS